MKFTCTIFLTLFAFQCSAEEIGENELTCPEVGNEELQVVISETFTGFKAGVTMGGTQEQIDKLAQKYMEDDRPKDGTVISLSNRSMTKLFYASCNSVCSFENFVKIHEMFSLELNERCHLFSIFKDNKNYCLVEPTFVFDFEGKL